MSTQLFIFCSFLHFHVWIDAVKSILFNFPLPLFSYLFALLFFSFYIFYSFYYHCYLFSYFLCLLLICYCLFSLSIFYSLIFLYFISLVYCAPLISLYFIFQFSHFFLSTRPLLLILSRFCCFCLPLCESCRLHYFVPVC